MSYTHFTRSDRIRLDALLRAGHNYRTIAHLIGFSIGAISYEVKRCGTRDSYNPYKAHRDAVAKRHSANQCHRKFKANSWHTRATIRLLKKGWSPEQIWGRFRLEHRKTPFSVPTIYNNINSSKLLSKHLPRRHNKYRRTKEGNERKRRRQEQFEKRSIEMRPKEVEQRNTIGHWEADTIIGKEKTTRILTYVERKTGYLLADIIKKATAVKVAKKTTELFKDIPDNKQETSTYDRGSEFAEYEQIEKDTKLDCYFAHAYQSWERGTSENTNGLIRRYYPKKTFFNSIKKKEFKKVVDDLNHRPRKRLGYKTPYEVFHDVQLRTLM